LLVLWLQILCITSDMSIVSLGCESLGLPGMMGMYAETDAHVLWF